MIPSPIETIAREVGGQVRGPGGSGVVNRVCTDSRAASPHSLFLALKGSKTDGHRFLGEAFKNRAAAALVSRAAPEIASGAGSAEASAGTLIVVDQPLAALQTFAARQRRLTFDKVLAITGSNGKTIVKDALAMLLSNRSVVASPGSYNSQLGLPLAVLSADQHTGLGIFEVGISDPGEMAAQRRIAMPDCGILTNIGMAHFASFGSRAAIAAEKMSLFNDVPETGWLLAPAQDPILEPLLERLSCEVYRVGTDEDIVRFTPLSLVDDGQLLRMADAGGESFDIRVMTRSPDLVTDLSYAASAARRLGVPLADIASGLDGYRPSATRMEICSTPAGIRIINDAYSSDPISVRAALTAGAFESDESGRKFFVFGGMKELGPQLEAEHKQIGAYAGERKFNQLFLVGNGVLEKTAEGYLSAFPGGQVVRVDAAADLQLALLPRLKWGDTVLFKGPRNAGLAQAARELTGSLSQRALWVDLAAIGDNIARFRRHIGGNRKIMAVLKALAYGTDLVNLAARLSRFGIHQLGVSATSEGISIRRRGYGQDIYVFLPDIDDIGSLMRYRLTPILHSAEMIDAFARQTARSEGTMNVHLKVNTGMNRMGVAPEQALRLAERIRSSGTLKLTGACTHFGAADEPAHDESTREQIAVFDRTLSSLRSAGFSDLDIHAANTGATIRFPEAHYSMVRIGIGLYGIYSSAALPTTLELTLAIGVTSRIASIQPCARGQRIGYGYSYTTARDILVATVPFGYDDGIPWRAIGNGYVLVNGRRAPVVGRVSMDQMQIDVTDVEGVGVGAEVLLYGQHGGHTLRPEEVAEAAHTIPHELLTRLGRRVHRVYVEP